MSMISGRSTCLWCAERPTCGRTSMSRYPLYPSADMPALPSINLSNLIEGSEVRPLPCPRGGGGGGGGGVHNLKVGESSGNDSPVATVENSALMSIELDLCTIGQHESKDSLTLKHSCAKEGYVCPCSHTGCPSHLDTSYESRVPMHLPEISFDSSAQSMMLWRSDLHSFFLVGKYGKWSRGSI